jgi:hypothetical protein
LIVVIDEWERTHDLAILNYECWLAALRGCGQGAAAPEEVDGATALLPGGSAVPERQDAR